MTALAIFVAILLPLGALYTLVAVFVCLDLGGGETHHWWCPLCQITRAFARRWNL